MKNIHVYMVSIASCVLMSLHTDAGIPRSIRPSYQTLMITNQTTMPLTVDIQASYVDTNTQQVQSDKKTLNIAPSGKNSFTYRLIKKTVQGNILYQGGLDAMKISDGKNLLVTYTSQKEQNGLQHFPGQTNPQYSYNYISIRQNKTTSSTPVYLTYDAVSFNVASYNRY